MASNPTDRETEAYFLRFMAGELQPEETVKVMMNPSFWDFLASSLPKDDREVLADEMVRRTLDDDATHPQRRISEKVIEGAKTYPSGEQQLRKDDEKFRGLYDCVPEGGRFDFLKDWFCGVDERGAEREAGGVGKEIKGEGKSEAQMDWTKSDAEVEAWLRGTGHRHV